MSSSYANKKGNEYYANHSIEQKLVRVIANSTDKRYYLFRNVLSSASVRECLKVVAEISHRHLSSIEQGGRKFDATAESPNSRNLQEIVRASDVFFQQRRSKSATTKQQQEEMKLPTFYLTVAAKLGIKNARLGPTERLIVHDPSLKVCYLFFYND